MFRTTLRCLTARNCEWHSLTLALTGRLPIIMMIKERSESRWPHADGFDPESRFAPCPWLGHWYLVLQVIMILPWRASGHGR